MTTTNTVDLANQVQKFWGPLFMGELRETALLPALVNRDYEGAITQPGDTVYVSMVTAATGENKTVGVDAGTFSPEKMATTRVSCVANKRAVASFEFEDLVQLQTQLGTPNGQSEIRNALMQGVATQINTYLYSLVAPSTSAPDHVLDTITDHNSAHMATLRKAAGKAKWMKDGQWYLLADPSYYSDILDDTVLANADYVDDRPVIAGQIAQPRFGFNVFEDNTQGLLNVITAQAGTDTEDASLAFHKDFMAMVMQQQPRYKISDLHSNKQFGYVISLDVVYGAVLAPQGANKHIFTFNT